jgi:iron complex outermembrane receptor protein
MACAPAMAQDALQGASDAPEGEIVVTAAKRSESLQAVPISVSAIGGDALSKSRITNVDSLVTKVANLQLTSSVGDNTPIFALRGVSMSDYSLNQSSPVATYYDEVYKGNFAFLGVAMYDLERVEVLRGPQGTLYGKNTTGGAVNIISRDAKLGETSGYVNATFPACANRPTRWSAGTSTGKARTACSTPRFGPGTLATSSTSPRASICWRASASITTTSATRAPMA